MNYYRKTYNIKLIAQIKLFFAWSFIFLIGYTYVAHDLMHGLNHYIHYDHTQECTVETEQDACHLALVHHQSDACQHPIHISNIESDCESCDFSFSPLKQNNRTENNEKFYHYFVTVEFSYCLPVSGIIQFNHQSRGPPLV